jgi:hypothetical protein
MSTPDLAIRATRAGDAAALAEAWVEFGRYYQNLDPARFRVPREEGSSDGKRRSCERIPVKTGSG